jgi:hypothetical protein
MEIYQELLLLAAQPRAIEESILLRRAALKLMPPDIRLMTRISEYVGEVALVSDVVKELGLRPSQAVVVGKALAKLDFTREMVRLDSRVYPLWVKRTRRYHNHKLALHNILRRRKICEAEERGRSG